MPPFVPVFICEFLNAEIRLEAAVNGYYRTRDEARKRVVREVKHRSHQIVGITETIHRRVEDNLLRALRKRAVLVCQERLVLRRQEPARRDRVHAHAAF